MPRRQRKCRVCGCTDDNCSECIDLTGGPCSWAEADLCTACVPVPVNVLSKGYMVVVENNRRMGSFAANGHSESIQVFDEKVAAEDLREQMRAFGHTHARVIEVTYTVRSDGLPARPCNKGTHTKKAR